MIYVGPLHPCNPSRKWLYRESCHLVTDSVDLTELHQLAELIGLRRDYFQRHPLLPHYDLTASKRREAIAAGARPISFTRLSTLIQERKSA